MPLQMLLSSTLLASVALLLQQIKTKVEIIKNEKDADHRKRGCRQGTARRTLGT